MRTTEWANGVVSVPLSQGDTLTIEASPSFIGDPATLTTGTTYTQICDDVTPGTRLLLSDGLIAVSVRSVEGTRVKCEVLNAGILKGKQGINLPNVRISAPTITDKDLKDLAFGLKNGVDFVAASFVRSAQDIHTLRAAMGDKVVPIVAKMEKPEAMDAMDAILEAADALMVARGDLGVEIPPHMVPIAQKRLVAAANVAGKPVIVATQMLEVCRGCGGGGD
jgi:pyruvate kinase